MKIRNTGQRLRCDFFVGGAGISGICAAVQAGRLGLRTILVEKEMFLGGNGGPNLGVGATGCHNCNPFWNETGIVEELEERVNYRRARLFPTNFGYNIHPLWDDVAQQMLTAAGVTVLRKHLIVEARRRWRTIVGMVLINIENLERVAVTVDGYVLDATGDAAIADLSGAEWVMGREGKDETGERSAPERGDAIVSAASVTALVADTGAPVEFTPPPDTPPWNPEKPDNHFNPRQRLHFLWQVDEGGDRADNHPLHTPQELHRKLVRRIYSVWHYLKNIKYPLEAKNFQLVWISPILGKRESRRIRGDYVLTETDITACRVFPDAVGFGGSYLDEHLPSYDGGYEVRFYLKPLPYDIPLRCLFSRNIRNLFSGGRAIGVSHLAFTSTRLMRTGGLLGQAAAVAAALCRQMRVTPRRLAAAHGRELQRELAKQDVWVIGADGRDPCDLAQQAVVSASSEAALSRAPRGEDWRPAVAGLAAALYGYPPQVERTAFYVRNRSSATVEVAAFLGYGETPPPELLPVPPIVYNPEKKQYEEARQHKRHFGEDDRVAVQPTGSQGWAHYGRRWDDVTQWTTTAEQQRSVPAGFQGWLECATANVAGFPPFDRSKAGQAVIVGMRGSVEILCAPHPVDTTEGLVGQDDGTWRPDLTAVPIFRIVPDPMPGRAGQVLDGCIHREGRTHLHQWMSDPSAGLPQWLQLDFDAPIVFNSLQARFDVTERYWHEMYVIRGERTARRCVADYRIEIERDGQWRTIITETDNYLRFRVHDLAMPVTTRRLRLMVNRVWGDGEPARVYEIRLYQRRTE